MSKNRIIPQMFDVRPVDETGDLDWRKIEAVGSDEKIVNKPQTTIQNNTLNDNKAKVGILGVSAESTNVPIFHDSSFDLNEISQNKRVEVFSSDFAEKQISERRQEIAEIAQQVLRRENEEKPQITEQQKQQQQAIQAKQKEAAQQEIITKQYESKLKEIVERNQILYQAAMQKQKEEAAELKKVLEQAAEYKAEIQRISEQNKQQQAVYKATILEEKEKARREHSEWLARQLQIEAKAKKLQRSIANKKKKK